MILKMHFQNSTRLNFWWVTKPIETMSFIIEVFIVIFLFHLTKHVTTINEIFVAKSFISSSKKGSAKQLSCKTFPELIAKYFGRVGFWLQGNLYWEKTVKRLFFRNFSIFFRAFCFVDSLQANASNHSYTFFRCMEKAWI